MTLVPRLAFGAALLAMAGCGGEPQSDLDADQAAERVEQHLTDAVENLPDSVEPEAVGPRTTAPCGDGELVTVTKRYWLDGLPDEDNEDTVEALHEYWKGEGYTAVEDLRPDRLFVHVRHDEDEFTMSVQESEQGDLSLGASSPCVTEHGSDT